ncbi:S-adenosyl-L-methionine-dependent methyltransferase [Hypoxylon sp. EC38]|nr:S-adenosyl-L-methionine-dependent methyltransferase [Hypoxylon sp. EC38]
MHPPLRKDGPDTRDQDSDMLDLVLENLSSSVRLALMYMEGPLKDTIQSRLHNEDKLPDAKCSSLAANAIDLLHRAQLILEPRSTILADHFLGYVNSKCLNAAVERGIPDVLATGPMTLEKLSEASESRADRLGQVLRVLYNNGIFEFDESTSLYRNNAASSLLRSDHWTQWRNWVELYGNQFYDVARGIPESTKKHATRWGAQINYDTDLNMFEYFQKQGWMELLHRTLGGGAEAMAPGIVEDYPWSELVEGNNGAVIVDIGGGGGGLIATLLRRFKNLHGAILDLPGVIAHARTLFHDKDGKYVDVGDRVSPEDLIGGDFFASVPRFEIYTMKWCLHDWKDEKALKILGNIRRAIIAGPKSRLIVMETVIENGRAQRLSRYGDIHMMMTANGFERTERQWRELARRSGWEVKKIYNLRNAWVKAIELVPASSGYVQGADVLEVQRLASQRELIKTTMGNQIHCPINFKKESMRILDIGTADGMSSCSIYFWAQWKHS